MGGSRLSVLSAFTLFTVYSYKVVLVHSAVVTLYSPANPSTPAHPEEKLVLQDQDWENFLKHSCPRGRLLGINSFQYKGVCLCLPPKLKKFNIFVMYSLVSDAFLIL